MRLHFLVVPVFDSAQATAELDRFLGSHRVLAIERELIADGGASVWAICVSYTLEGGKAMKPSGKPRLDYREVLPAAEFEVFARLRSLRKKRAEEEGIPIYSVFTNAQLAEMVQKRAAKIADLAAIEGVGEARLRKYGEEFLKKLGSWMDEDSSRPNLEDRAKPEAEGNTEDGEAKPGRHR